MGVNMHEFLFIAGGGGGGGGAGIHWRIGREATNWWSGHPINTRNCSIYANATYPWRRLNLNSWQYSEEISCIYSVLPSKSLIFTKNILTHELSWEYWIKLTPLAKNVGLKYYTHEVKRVYPLIAICSPQTCWTSSDSSGQSGTPLQARAWLMQKPLRQRYSHAWHTVVSGDMKIMKMSLLERMIVFAVSYMQILVIYTNIR